MSNKIAIIYNTCGISGNNDIDFYAAGIDSILAQDMDHTEYTLVISSVVNDNNVRHQLMQKYGADHRVDIAFIDEIVPVNVSFNSAVKKVIEKRGVFEGYMYMSSDSRLTQTNTLSILYDILKTNEYSMVGPQVDNDHGYDGWLGKDPGIWSEHEIIGIGKAVNLHTMIFSEELRLTYPSVMPDIFAAHCTESVFSFLNAAINKKWIIHKELRIEHYRGEHRGDGPSVGFPAAGPRGNTWDYFYLDARTLDELINDPIGKEAGFGYEEIREICISDKSKFDNNGYALDNRLKGFLIDKLYLKPHEFNYNNIKGTYT